MIYSEKPKILIKNKNEIIVVFDRTKIAINKKDEICVLSDPLAGAIDYYEPDISNMDFDEFYENIDGADDSGSYSFIGDLQYIHGISVLKQVY